LAPVLTVVGVKVAAGGLIVGVSAGSSAHTIAALTNRINKALGKNMN